MKFENTTVMNFEGAFRGMRNPKESWGKSDSDFTQTCHSSATAFDFRCCQCEYFAGEGKPCYPNIGQADLKLAQTLIKGGSEHRKFMRQIFISVDITAPLYFWKEFDTYKIGTVANSTSTMHKLLSKPIVSEMFEMGDYDANYALINNGVDTLLHGLEKLRLNAIDAANKAKEAKETEVKKAYTVVSQKYWKELVRWLPESWLQTRTITMNYENLYTMVRQRQNHKLSEWHSFVDWAKTLPYANELIFIE